MRYERFIAQRYLRSKRQLRFITIIMMVSVIGITVGVAALIIVLSVFNGFNGVVTNVLVSFDPHLRVEAKQGASITVSPELVQEIRSDPRVAAAATVATGKGLLMTSSVNRVVEIRGVSDSSIGSVSGVARSVVLGRFRFNDAPGHSGIVLGLALADRLGATVGSEITIVSPVGVDAMLMQFGQPLTQRCTVVGIYDSQNKDYDAHYAYVSLETAQRLFDLGTNVTGVEIRLHSLADADQVKASLLNFVPSSFTVSSWYDIHKSLYSVMKVERWSAYIILCLIVGVATFNVLGSLTMGVIEKRRDIGVLKALGSTRASIIRVFMVEGLLVGSLGTVAGLLIGYAVCYLQIRYSLFPLDTSVYIIPAIPVEFRLMDFFSVSFASLVLSTLASLYPAFRAAALQPVEAIRWE